MANEKNLFNDFMTNEQVEKKIGIEISTKNFNNTVLTTPHTKLTTSVNYYQTNRDDFNSIFGNEITLLKLYEAEMRGELDLQMMDQILESI